MRGSFLFEVYNKRLRYKIFLERSVTIIKGNSGTGKTQLLRMIDNYLNFGKSSGVHITSYADKIRLLENKTNWVEDLQQHENSIYFADEDVNYITTKAFADLIFKTGSYLVYITRTGLTGFLTYAVTDICAFSCSNKNNQYTNSLYKIFYSSNESFKPDVILTEDSTSGKDMLSKAASIITETSNGKDNIITKLDELASSNVNIYVIIDGAAYGNQIQKLLAKRKLLTSNNIDIFAPESFEFLLLSTPSLRNYCIDELRSTADYVESSKYKTWENYFESLIKDVCDQIGVVYKKTTWSSLDSYFKSSKILSELKELLIDIQ